MSRGRLVVLLSLIVIVLGSVVAVGAFFLDPARAAVGPLPAEGLLLPADARFVAGLDVKRFTASPLYQRYGAQARPEALTELEQKTGLVPERDVDQVLFAGPALGGPGTAMAVVLGSFDTYKLGRAIETNNKTAGRVFEGITEYVFQEANGRRGPTVALLDRQALLIGSQAMVEAALTSRARGASPLSGNPGLIGLLERVKTGSTFWMVGDQSLLQNLPGTIPSPGGGGNSISLPALKSLIVTGDLDPHVSVAITGDATDEAGARNLANIVSGFMSLAALQMGQRPELKGLAEALNVTTNGNRVLLQARIPYEMVDALGKAGALGPMRPAPPSAAPVAPAPAPR